MREEYDFSHARRGAVVDTTPSKIKITIRLDSEIVEHFKRQVLDAGGGNDQTLINKALREHIERQNEPFEQLLRRVLREELAQAK